MENFEFKYINLKDELNKHKQDLIKQADSYDITLDKSPKLLLFEWVGYSITALFALWWVIRTIAPNDMEAATAFVLLTLLGWGYTSFNRLPRWYPMNIDLNPNSGWINIHRLIYYVFHRWKISKKVKSSPEYMAIEDFLKTQDVNELQFRYNTAYVKYKSIMSQISTALTGLNTTIAKWQSFGCHTDAFKNMLLQLEAQKSQVLTDKKQVEQTFHPLHAKMNNLVAKYTSIMGVHVYIDSVDIMERTDAILQEIKLDGEELKQMVVQCHETADSILKNYDSVTTKTEDEVTEFVAVVS